MIRALYSLLLAATLTLNGCLVIGSGGAEGPTVGTELVDLKKARDQGIITQAEFEQAKAALLERAEKK